jgi:hypothetical protein
VQQGDDPKFSANCLIRKDDPQVAVIQQAINTEKQNTFPNGFPANGKLCLKDCEQFPEYYELRANTGADNPPHVVQLPGAKPVTDRSKVYPGAVAWFVININGYNQPVNKGIGGYINGIGLTGEEGPLGRLDNKPTPEQMFANVGAGAPMAPPAAPVAPAPMAPPAAPVHQMTAAAGGVTREAYHAAGWTDAQLVEYGLMMPPAGVPTRF